LLIGLAIQVISLVAVGVMFQTNSSGPALLAAILAFISAFAMSIGPVSWIVCSEIFPTKVRGRAMSVATFTIWVGCYLVAQTFPMMKASPLIGPAGAFWIYAACCVAAFLFVLKMVPETKGRTLEEIELSWRHTARLGKKEMKRL